MKNEISNNEWFAGAGGFKKIKDAQPPCLCPAHNPPSHIVLEPGTYEYTCPSCGHVTKVEVPFVSC